ncbi:MAG: hypothetical protein TH68_04415 [Candidatus Synechococcus spongiarum 142]|uniref:Uncharacterized protein n=1 Tax=Candidatus Synechococcus spongiarum 142 TaxID=1608213 RepID=A0A6N3XBF4_9SYNE|nr:MAG: hypothetical protein TH68_04415 [Candidatus Synechococcus spongiarum 142]
MIMLLLMHHQIINKISMLEKPLMRLIVSYPLPCGEIAILLRIIVLLFVIFFPIVAILVKMEDLKTWDYGLTAVSSRKRQL